MKLTKRAQFLLDNLDLPAASGVETARWEHFQIEHFCYDGKFRIENKSRQVSWSFTASAEAVADAFLEGQSSFFVSINYNEAIEKIRYARQIENNLRLRLSGLPQLVVNNQLGLEYDNGARLISLPSKAPRGKARFNVYLDEFAHVQSDLDIYTASLPVVSKGGRVRIGSSPFGASGVFWEIFTETLQPYSGYSRKETPWWHTFGMCLNVKEAIKIAHTLPTDERVERFGNDRLKSIFQNVAIESFQQEFECSFTDKSTSLISFTEIRTVSSDNLICFKADCVNKNTTAAYEAIDELLKNHLEISFAAGLDIGRTRNTTELFLIGLTVDSLYPLRLMISLDNVDFDDQYDIVSYALSKLPIVKLFIDRNGLGMNLAEKLGKAFPYKAEGVLFSNASKALWATNAKMLISQHKTPLPTDRELAYQINSIKRIVTASKNLVFDTNKTEKHHADKFWAWALALAAAHEPTPKPIIQVIVSKYHPKPIFN